MPVGFLHAAIRKVASTALAGFFREVHVIGEENVPRDGPLIVVCTHHNMMIDPTILSSTMPDLRPLHYWAKASLFKHPIARKILLASGVIPVDRGSKDNRKLFAGTFDALSQDDAVALFPEGTSYTLPRIVQVKDGASWSALEYMKWVAEGGKNTNNGKELVIIPAGITYTDKSKYRSSAVIEYGPPIPLAEFKRQFLSTKEGDARAAVKALTHAIEQALVELTINAPNWEVLYSARMARDLLFESWRGVPLHDFKDVGQTLVDLFATPWDADPSFVALKKALITYHSLLKSTHLTNGALSTLPLSKRRSTDSVPSRMSTIGPLLRESVAVGIRLPLFLVPMLVHLPIYWVTRWVGEKSAEDEEAVAQSKAVVGLILCLTIYSVWFWIISALFWATGLGFVIAALTVWAMASYHSKLIDDNYIRAKRLLSAYRVLVGVWGPQRWDMSLSALTQYTVTQPPPPNPFLKLPDSVKDAFVRSSSSPTVPTLASTSTDPSSSSGAGAITPTTPKSNKRPPSRKLIRHLLRARAEAVRRLAAFIRRIDKDDVRVAASGFMAKTYGGGLDSLFTVGGGDIETVSGGVEAELNPTGWRNGKEVVAYLKSKGAMVGKLLREGESGEQPYQWDVLSSEGELSSPGSAGVSIKQEEMEWVIPGSK
ncbi:related to glycerol-3-phosphate-acyltransferase-Laccaria bicolor [Serendipita indica DSM 11827]|uniref:Related to glycerol-3-phosphate-acyltransferase-Laccaria bicolor n=1 Tax=Serendipita indica (strain DSM 11827) TaxID=1109443 RepID=G4TQJ9_SERID|nr:related to glycerol-3-phosphate-acyltransferase-Laccaria bicolor [Serendipita indica DSM 11827]